MTEKQVYLVSRWEMSMSLSETGVRNIPDRVFLNQDSANNYCLSLDPEGKGFHWECPCGCGDDHWRSWDYEPIVMEE